MIIVINVQAVFENDMSIANWQNLFQQN